MVGYGRKSFYNHQKKSAKLMRENFEKFDAFILVSSISPFLAGIKVTAIGVPKVSISDAAYSVRKDLIKDIRAIVPTQNLKSDSDSKFF